MIKLITFDKIIIQKFNSQKKNRQTHKINFLKLTFFLGSIEINFLHLNKFYKKLLTKYLNSFFD